MDSPQWKPRFRRAAVEVAGVDWLVRVTPFGKEQSHTSATRPKFVDQAALQGIARCLPQAIPQAVHLRRPFPELRPGQQRSLRLAGVASTQRKAFPSSFPARTP